MQIVTGKGFGLVGEESSSQTSAAVDIIRKAGAGGNLQTPLGH